MLHHKASWKFLGLYEREYGKIFCFEMSQPVRAKQHSALPHLCNFIILIEVVTYVVDTFKCAADLDKIGRFAECRQKLWGDLWKKERNGGRITLTGFSLSQRKTWTAHATCASGTVPFQARKILSGKEDYIRYIFPCIYLVAMHVSYACLIRDQ